MKLIRYQLQHDEYTTYWLREPYDSDGESLVQDIGLMSDGHRYVIVPNGVTVPDQPVVATEDVAVTDSVREMIAAESPHARLLAERAAERPDWRYPKPDIVTMEYLREVGATGADKTLISDWIREHAGEWAPDIDVSEGVLRSYNGQLYECIQPHTTQSDWTPPQVPALWLAILLPDQPKAWMPQISVEVGEEYWYPDTDGTLYRVIQPHTTQTGWEPPNVPALWEAV